MIKSATALLSLMALTASALCAEGAKSSSREDVFVDISEHANMGFVDEIAGDGKGGWSDQGPENDLRLFDVKGIASFEGCKFKIIDPAANGGRAVMTFASPHINENVSLREAPIRFTQPLPARRNLYILHSSCWNVSKDSDLVGTLKLKFVDGTSSTYEVRNKKELADWWRPTALPNGLVVWKCRTAKGEAGSVGLYMSKFSLPENAPNIAEMDFVTAEKSIWIVVAASLSDADVSFAVAKGEIGMPFEGNFKPIDTSKMLVKPGSALDLSRFVGEFPAGSFGRVATDANGHFTFEGKPGARIKFNGCSMSPLVGDTMSSKENIEAYAMQVKLHGFNLVRPHFLDIYLMQGSKADLDFNADALEKFDYFVDCMKRNGIYIYLDAMTSWSGYVKGSSWAAKAVDLKRRMFWDPKAKENWSAGVRKLLTHVNPYTKSSLAEDPVVATVLLLNEQEIELRAEKLDTPEFCGLWRAWLKESYQNTEGLRKAWTDSSGRCWLENGATIDNIEINGKKYFWESNTSPRGRDIGRFLAAESGKITDWYLGELRAMGYKGLVSQWDFSRHFCYYEAREKVSVVSAHNYFAHPTNWIGKGSTINVSSSIMSGAAYFSDAAVLRQWGKPLFVTEYLHCFWNPYRYEQGALFGAYSALQDFDGLMEHAEPVALSVKDPIKTFCAFNDPVAIASQTLCNCLFMGSCEASRNRLLIGLDKNRVAESGLKQVPEEYGRLALVSGLGVDWSHQAGPGLAGKKVELPENLKGKFQVAGFLSSMRQDGLLGQSNRTNPEKGVFESDTQEIFMDIPNGELRVSTPLAEAICMARPKPTDLKHMTVHEANVPSSIAIVSIDGIELEKSGRILLIFSTNALNTGMKFADEEGSTLLDVGKLPVQMRTGTLCVSLKRKPGHTLKAWALSLDGSRGEELALEASQDSIKLTMDTAKLKNGPTPFFEISEK